MYHQSDSDDEKLTPQSISSSDNKNELDSYINSKSQSSDVTVTHVTDRENLLPHAASVIKASPENQNNVSIERRLAQKKIKRVDEHVLKKYTLLEKLGHGAYGICFKVQCLRTNRILCLKKCFEAFGSSTDAQRCYREIMILMQLRGHQNVINLENVMKANNHKDIYLVTDYMESDLHAVIRGKILAEVHKQYVVYQIAKALK